MPRILRWLLGLDPKPRGRDSPSEKSRQWELDKPAFALSKHDILTLRDLAENVIAFGRVGAGKTSCMNALAYRLLAMGAGMLVLCVKNGEAERWRQILKKAGRTYKCIGPGHAESIDIVGEEYRAGGYSANVANLFTELMGLVDRRGGGQDTGDKFWTHASARAIGYAVDIVAASGRPVTARRILDTITSAPTSKSQYKDEKWRGESAYFVFAGEGKAGMGGLPEPARQDFLQACGYFSHEWAELAPETRSSILANITAVMGPLVRAPLREMFTANPTIGWDYVFGGGVLIFDMSTHTYGFAGQLAQVAAKYAFQKSAQRRAGPLLLALLWVDEYFELGSPSDVPFVSVSREVRAPMILLTQNVSNLHLCLGGEHQVMSLLGNMKSKFFFSSDDAPTVRYGCELGGREIRIMASGGTSDPRDRGIFDSIFAPDRGGTENSGWSEQYQQMLECTDFSGLKTGGPHGYAEALIFVGGRVLSSGYPFIRVALRQC